MDYQLLEVSARLNLVRARLQELERQHFTLSMRVEAPDLSQPVSSQDEVHLARLQESIDFLRQKETELSSQNPHQSKSAAAGES